MLPVLLLATATGTDLVLANRATRRREATRGRLGGGPPGGPGGKPPDGEPPFDKARVLREAKAWRAEHFPSMLNRSGGCLAAAVAVIIVAGKYGRRLALQAGSAYWTRMTPEQDDGVSPTHFGYEWEDTPETRACIRAGMLPEIHVWAGDPARQEIVDPTSGEFPAQCRVLLGEDWLAPRPPDALWVPVAQIPPNAIYTPSREATQVAAVFAQRMLRGE